MATYFTDPGHNGHIVFASSFQDLEPLDTSTSFESRASVSSRLVLLDKLDVLEIVRP